jgi:hypothetical protein
MYYISKRFIGCNYNMNILKFVYKYHKYGLVRGDLKYLQISSEFSLIFSIVGL